MCGIVGIGVFTNSGIYSYDLTTFQQALIADSVRGLDGTGIIRVSREGNTTYKKSVGTPFDLFRSPGVIPWLRDGVSANDRLLIGHNRLASVGSVSTANSHPFEHGTITLVHNGKIWNSRTLIPDMPSNLTVDSEELCYAMSKLGVRDTLERILGAYSIVFYDSSDKTLNFYRNAERPMFIGSNKKQKRILFGSEREMLEWLSMRNTLGIDDFKEVPIHTLVTYKENGKITLSPITPKPVTYTAPTTTANTECDDYFAEIDDVPLTNVVPFTKPLPFSATPPYQATKTTHYTSSHTSNADYFTSKDYMFPDSVYGYKKGDQIQFMPVESERSSSTQEQYKIKGCHPQFSEIEINCFTKGTEFVTKLVKEVMLTATVRCFERRRKVNGETTVLILCSHPRSMLPDNTSSQKELKSDPQVPAILLPPNATVQ